MFIKTSKVGALCVLLGFSLPSFANDGTPVLKIGSKTYSAQELEPSIQANWYDFDLENYMRKKATLESKILDAYFEQEAAKRKTTRQAVEDQELKVADIKEAELKKFYEENKSKIPYPFEQVSGEIKNMLQSQKRQENRSKMIEKASKALSASILMTEPVSPKVTVDVAGFHRFGKQGAKVQIIEFADYQCPHCKIAAEAFKKVREKYKDKVDFVYIDYPINSSGISKQIAIGAYCASKQNKYWEYHEAAFKDQSNLNKDSMVKLAKDLKLDIGGFSACVVSPDATQFVEKSKAEGDRVGVSGTPTILINGQRSRVAHSYEAIAKEIDRLSR